MARFLAFLAAAAAAVLLAFLLYARTLGVPFLLDDLVAVPVLHPEGALDLGAAARVIWPTDPAHAYHGHFRPLGWASVVADASFFGFDPPPLRAVAIAIHGLVAFLTGLAARLLVGRGRPLAALTAAAFVLVAPAAVEPVVWLSHRFTLLAALFFLAGQVAAIAFARSGRGVLALGAFALAGMLAKDSMLAEAWALPTAVLVSGVAGHRVRRSAAAALAVVLAALLVLLLRSLSIGTLLPTVAEGGDVIQTFDLSRAAAALPRSLLLLLAPTVGRPPAGQPVVFFAAWLTLLLGAGALCVLALRTAAGRRAAVVLLVVILAGLPVFDVSFAMDAARYLYLPGALLAIVVATALRGRALLLAAVALAAAATLLRGSQDRYRAVGDYVRKVVARIEASARPAEPCLVTGLPSSWRGVPCFGPELAHLEWYFDPPLASGRLEVLGAEAGSLGARLALREGAARLLLFDPEASPEDAPRLRHALRVPAPAGAGSPALILLEPGPGTRWPGAGALALRYRETDATPAPHAVCIAVASGGVRCEWMMLVADGVPGVTTAGAGGVREVAIRLDQVERERLLLPPAHAAALAGIARGSLGVPATLEILRLEDAAAPGVAPARSGAVPIELGGPPR